ncbi:hypothetical protein CPB83DRAFT_887488 [Crepidotus variabilis]|uniref:Uncharacterized protein n=1 Tax=Crepidotus variabilis TaxID=179855 RepID=A0A9P6E4Q7_9AGAR|nr:hypothetical protein CPB83DRAFT_887488 [Crepidotus variabilis]
MDFGGYSVRIEKCIAVSSITITAWDILENLPADLRLYQDHPVRFPSLAYCASRMVTLVVFVLIALQTLALNVHYYGPNGPLSESEWLVTTVEILPYLMTIQRGLTSLVFYLRIHALYQSNYWIRGVIIVCLLGVMITTSFNFGLSGPISGVFDLLVFFVIVWKLGWCPALRQVSLQARERSHIWSFWVPFRRSAVYKITDRLLQDSLLYLLLAIAIKIPQAIYWTDMIMEEHFPAWLEKTIYLDLALNTDCLMVPRCPA